jgi:hypothetical protein
MEVPAGARELLAKASTIAIITLVATQPVGLFGSPGIVTVLASSIYG